MTNETQAIRGTAARTVGYEYFADGRRKKLVYTDGTYITYQYNTNGWITAILDGGTNTIVSYSYDAAGRRTVRTLENSTFTVYGYDDADQLTNLWHRQSSGSATNTVSQYLYGYDNSGNRTWVKHANGKGDVYRYDAADQLTNVRYEASSPDVQPASWTNNVQYSFDEAGNRATVVQIVGTSTNTYTYNANSLNQYTLIQGPQNTQFSYDFNGNLSNDTVWTHSYDYENRLIRSASGGIVNKYAYDAFGRLIRNKGNGSTVEYYYAGWQLIEERDNTGTLLAKYVYGPGIDEPVRMTRNGTNYYYHADGLGSVAEVTDRTGAKLEQYAYDVYGAPSFRNGAGNPIASSGIGNRLLFTGRDRDTDTGLYNYRFRYYSPGLGRFVQVDPTGLLGRDMNLYRYVRNDPVYNQDPYGQRWKETFASIIAGLALGLNVGQANPDLRYPVPNPPMEEREKQRRDAEKGTKDDEEQGASPSGNDPPNKCKNKAQSISPKAFDVGFAIGWVAGEWLSGAEDLAKTIANPPISLPAKKLSPFNPFFIWPIFDPVIL